MYSFKFSLLMQVLCVLLAILCKVTCQTTEDSSDDTDNIIYIYDINAACYAYCWEDCLKPLSTLSCQDCKENSEWLNTCNTTSCNGQCQNFGILVPPRLTLEALRVRPNITTVAWKEETHVSRANSIVVVVIQYRGDWNREWKYLTMSTNVSGEFHFITPSVCQQMEFRSAIISKVGTFGFDEIPIKEIAQITSLMVHEPKKEFVGNDTIIVDIRWQIDPKWTKVMDKSKINAHQDCYNKEARASTNPDETSIDGMGPFHVRIGFKREMYGCIIPLYIETFATCNMDFIKVETHYNLDLVECKDIKNFPCDECEDHPQNTQSVEELKFPSQKSHGDKIDVLVEWDNPSVFPCNDVSHYILKWGRITLLHSFLPAISTIEDIPEQEVNVPGNETSLMIYGLDPDTKYGAKIFVVYSFQSDIKPDINIVSVYVFDTVSLQTTTDFKLLINIYKINSTSANSSFNNQIDDSHSSSSSSTPNYRVILYVSVPAVILLICVVFLCWCICFRRKRNPENLDKHSNGIHNPMPQPNFYISHQLREQAEHSAIAQLVTDKWEIPHDQVMFGETLGQGAFGQVLQGEIESRFVHQIQRNCRSSVTSRESLKSQYITVAIKMLHGTAGQTQKEDFLQEMRMMKTMGYHCNVISLIACCTVREPFCLIIEHCEKGDLQNYLRQKRNEILEARLEAGEEIWVNEESLTPRDLLSFARQIAVGMEFLSQMGFVHRDLAARNILVAEHKTVKIGDFGLTRYIYDDKIYVNRRGGKLPVKWMAVESIFDHIYQSSSDVWSFGIVLFELVTLGGTPYPGISNQDLIKLLKKGYRMEKPENCTNEMYKLMQACWRDKPGSRPTFSNLRQQLEKMIEENTSYLDFNFDQNKGYYNIASSESSSGDSVFVGGAAAEAVAMAIGMDTESPTQRSTSLVERKGEWPSTDRVDNYKPRTRSAEADSYCNTIKVVEPECEYLLSDQRSYINQMPVDKQGLNYKGKDYLGKEVAEMEHFLGGGDKVLGSVVTQFIEESKV